MTQLRQYASQVLRDQGNANKDLAQRVAEFECGVIEDILRIENGSVSAAAQTLNIPRNTLYDRMSRYGLVARTFKAK